MSVSSDRTPRPMWTRAIALVTAATFMLQGCGSGIGSNDGAADTKDTLGAPSTAVPTDLNSLMAGTGAELVGEPEFRLVKAADVELPDGVEQLEDVVQADTALAEKAASLVRINNVNPALYRCTVTQNFAVAEFYEPYHSKVASVMRARNNVITGAKMNQIISTHFRNGLAVHVGGSAAGYLYANNVNSQTRYTGYLRGSGAQASRSLFASEISFNTSYPGLCQAETSSQLSAVNGNLSPFWAALVAGVSGSVAFGLTVIGILAVAPELVGGDTPGAWDIAACSSALVAVVIYEAAVKGGNFGWQTWVSAFAGCAAATLPQYAVRGKWASTYAPWILKAASGIRGGVINFWGWARNTVAIALDNLSNVMQAYDSRLPIPR
jgi:hypothetical protein